jgi:hypothetical protein
MLVSPSRNLIRDQLYKAQLEYHNINTFVRSLQCRLKKTTNGGQQFEQAYVQKETSKKNLHKRVEYV